jgi:hypothetical protein
MQFTHYSSRGVPHYRVDRYLPPYVESRTDMLIRVGDECVRMGATATHRRMTPTGEEEITVFVHPRARRIKSRYLMAGGVRIGWGLKMRAHVDAGHIVAEAVGHLLRPGKHPFSHFTITMHNGWVLECKDHAARGECLLSMANDFQGLTHLRTGAVGLQNAALVELPGFPGRVFIQALKRITWKEILVWYGTKFGKLRTQVPV